MRYRELNTLLPLLAERGIHVQLVTSAVREIPLEWHDLPRFSLTVSIDGLQPEHDARRTPATYERILKHIAGHEITVHCTVTRQQVNRPGYIEEFLALLVRHDRKSRRSGSASTRRRSAKCPTKCLRPDDRTRVVTDLQALRLALPEAVGARRSFSTCTPTRHSRRTNACSRA